MRDYNTKQLGRTVTSTEDALQIVRGVTGDKSIFGTRDRIAMPDETLYFNTGSDRDKGLLLYTLLQHSSVKQKQGESDFIAETFLA